MSQDVWSIKDEGTVPVGGPVTALEVGLVGGRVDVVAGDGPGARVEVHDVHGHPVEVSSKNGKLKVGYRGSFVAHLGQRGRDRADVQITVPADVAVNLGVVKADGLVAGIRGKIKASTVSGPVVVDQCEGELEVSTVSGEMVVRDHTGDVKASSVSGPLTVSGAVPVLEASTVSGDLLADLTVAPRTATLSGVSADVTLRVPDADELALRLNAATGRVVVDGAEHTDVRHKGVVLDRRAGGDSKATINTVSGAVTVLSGRTADA
ncbi:DUF4097 family beta strand repeat-containing protein [Luteimicrobium subarcticum]|uniref:Putative adhesin n=1 Tax=Luteimicrobium subarcticum TaxID=620910 RepID=A0A2M8WWC5_9MICO|nr:DUF4097 family beta strand repeat-containing protein [Luteimicrobium subarcticum]PJI95224.1 putative adhesin [Luteimicrobium subarcticum]